MGLPERIKASIAARDDARAAKNEDDKPKQAAARAKSPGKSGLPPFKAPQIPRGYRALLVACSETRQASWAVLKENPNKTYSFSRNIRAVPDPKVAKQGEAVTSRAASSGASTDTESSQLPPDISMDRVYLQGFSCGCCGADGSAGSMVVLCGECHTLQCRPHKKWTCPGCGKYIESVQGTIDSVRSTEGSQPTQPARSGLAAGPGREALTSAAPATTDKSTPKKPREK